MEIGTFNIGEAFPAHDPVARFVTMLAMVGNDGNRLLAAMDAADPEDGELGLQILLFRLLASLHFEAAERIRDARKRYPQIRAFISGLHDARDLCEATIGSIDPRSEHYIGDWAKDHRNVTFHYPEIDPNKVYAGTEELTAAMTKAAAMESAITVDSRVFGKLRMPFADDVVIQWLPDAVKRMDQLRDAVVALLRFVYKAMAAYIAPLLSGGVIRQQS
jgi:hypothetical protein